MTDNSINPAIVSACKELGSQVALSRAIGVQPANITQWLNNSRPVPIMRCIAIEQVTNGVVTRKDLRPDDWHMIWPELVDKRAVA